MYLWLATEEQPYFAYKLIIVCHQNTYIHNVLECTVQIKTIHITSDHFQTPAFRQADLRPQIIKHADSLDHAVSLEYFSLRVRGLLGSICCILHENIKQKKVLGENSTPNLP